ncbi:MAG TPA: gliding motility-associated ABC transporter substrate-binding protein GldG [Bacteroidales bacterium]|nr:gliding motility-associated ABC transporter substrate-binding protein GldG [Bacteroidales bacterium]
MDIFFKSSKPKSKETTWRRDLRKQSLLQLMVCITVIVAVNTFGSLKFARLDLTSEKRFTLSPGTRSMLRQLDDIVYFRVYLEGDFPAGFQKFSNQTREILGEFRAFSDNIQYEFINPLKAPERDGIIDMLIEKGLQPTQVQVRAHEATSQQIIFPGALVNYRGREIPLQLLEDQLGKSPEEILNYSAQALEYNLANAIRQITITEKPGIGFIDGQGEIAEPFIADIKSRLSDFYQVERVRIGNNLAQILQFKTLILAKPQKPFTEEQKFVLDQYIMQGGSMLWLIDPVFASMDSLRPPLFETIGMGWPVNLDDMLFRYGVRLNANLLQDLNAAPIPVTTGMIGNRPQINLLPWYFFPLLNPASNHKIVNNLNLIRSEFISSIDTVYAPEVRKTILLQTSPYTRNVSTPAMISLDILSRPPDERNFAEGPQSVAVLLEGTFESVFRNRLAPPVNLPEGFQRRNQSVPTAMIVVADGDIIKNQLSRDGQPLPLGYDRFSAQTFGNSDFIMNSIDFLADDSGILEARAREMRLRMLDRSRVDRSRTFIQLTNVMMPVVLVVTFGLARFIWRRKKYGSKTTAR